MEQEIFILPDNYKLAWSEDFTRPLDTDLWLLPDCPRRGGYWSPGQAIIENEKLVIRTEYRENADHSGYYTGCLMWKNLRATYGYYEIRCKLQNTKGEWPAFWLMPDSMSGRNADVGCEIDIFENAISYRIQNALHWNRYHSQKKNGYTAKDLYDGFHTFALDWKKDSLKFYYDNKLLWDVNDPKLISHAPVKLEISTEINGRIHKGDTPKPGRLFWIGNGIITDQSNKLPSDFIVDSVKVYDNGELTFSKSNFVSFD